MYTKWSVGALGWSITELEIRIGFLLDILS